MLIAFMEIPGALLDGAIEEADTTDENVLLYDGDERDKKMMITEVQDNRDKEYETYL